MTFDNAFKKKRYIPDFAPDAPGRFMKEFLLPNLGIGEGDILAKTALSAGDLQSIFNGDTPIDDELADRLRPALGDAADNLRKQQELFDYHTKHNEWPV